jgi:hypothetical protein
VRCAPRVSVDHTRRPKIVIAGAEVPVLVFPNTLQAMIEQDRARQEAKNTICDKDG